VTKKLLILVLVLALCLIVFAPLAAGAGTSGSIPLEPGPVIIDTTTETTVPTLLPTLTEPTTERTTQPTTEETTTVPTVTIGGGKGWIDVYGNVDGATVYFDGRAEGTIAGGILSVAVSPTGTPVSTITVSKSGYQSWSGSPARMPAANEHVAVYATINPLTTVPTTIPPVTTGAIYAQSNPNGAAIYLNGNFQGYAPLNIPNLYPGTYSMKATLSGYTPDTAIINVYAGQTATYYPVLQQSPQPRQTGTVYVTSNPNYASVSVDGTYYGKTPLTISLYPGSHTIVISLAGYNDYTTYIGVTAGQSQNLPVTLSTAIFGSFTLTSVPGAKVYMDSAEIGTTNSAGNFRQTGITSGNHLFKVTASGYNDWMNTVYIQANTVTSISASLTPKGISPTPVQPTGGLAIASSPTNAAVYVDDLPRGNTPLTVTDLVPGDHVVRISSDGYLDYTTTTTVTSGQTAPLAVTLTVAPTPTPTSSPAPAPVLVVGVLAAALLIEGHMRRRS
jgi:hypothetical protein